MCAQIKERKVKEKYSKERGWRVRDRHTQIHGGREGERGQRERESVAGEEEVVGR